MKGRMPERLYARVSENKKFNNNSIRKIALVKDGSLEVELRGWQMLIVEPDALEGIKHEL